MPENKPVPAATQRSVTSAEAIKKMEKELYRETLMRDHDLKRGSKYPPMNIEPFPFERQRIAGGYTDADRALRKQWLQDQILTDREPVHVERWTRRNVFRRVWNAPFNALERAMTSAGLPVSVTYFTRFAMPKLVGGLAAMYALWVHLKIGQRSWETGVGMSVNRMNAATLSCVPGTRDWDRMIGGEFRRDAKSFNDLGFSKRTAFRDEKLVTSAAGPQLDGSTR